MQRNAYRKKQWKPREIEKKTFSMPYGASDRQKDCGSMVAWMIMNVPLPMHLIPRVKSLSKNGELSLDETRELVRLLLVMACAGAGKTTTVFYIINLLVNELGFKGKILLTSFANSIVKELEKYIWQFPGVEAKGLHALGFSCLKSAFGNITLLKRKGPGGNDKAIKTEKICEKLEIDEAYPWDKEGEEQADAFKCLKAIEDVVHFVKVSLTDWKDIEAVNELIAQYNIELNGNYDIIIDNLNEIMEESLRQCTVIDFDDMIWLVIMLKLKVPQYDLLFGDETQDYTKAQIELIDMTGAKLVLVGDRFQAIYGFAGADIHSVDNIQAKFNYVELPLDVNYRCPVSVITEAQKVITGYFLDKCIDKDGSSVIKPWDGAEQGEVITIEQEELLDRVELGDFIGSRKNAPLVPTAFRLFKNGKPCSIKGKSIQEQIINLFKKICKKCESIDACLEALDNYREKQTKKIMRRYKDGAASILEGLDDQVDTLSEFIEQSPSVDKVVDTINAMFSKDDKMIEGEIALGSCHYSKGLEFDRCFFLEWDDFMTMRENSTESDYEQRRNLKYISITRAKKTLFFVRKPKKDQEE